MSGLTSWDVLSWARAQACANSGEKFVLIMLACRVDESGTCFPGIDTLAEDMQMGRSTVERHLANLVRAGKVRILQRWRRRGSRTSNRYQLLVQGEATPVPAHDDWQRVYEPVDNSPVDDADGMSLDSSGIAEQGDHDPRIEGDAGRSADLRDSLPSDRGVTSESELPGVELPPQPPAQRGEPCPAGTTPQPRCRRHPGVIGCGHRRCREAHDAQRARVKPPHCGHPHCDPDKRMRLVDGDPDRPRPCPECRPLAHAK